jgi:histidinol-phosphate aminotransferase
MAISRRSFFAALGAGGAGVLAAPLITWRGHESLQAQGAAARRADRLLAARPGVIRIDSNENPNGPGERVYSVIRRHLGESNRYPVRSEDDLALAIARTHGILPENVILGSGSGELLRAAVSAFGSASRAVVSPDPTFEACASWARFIGAPVVAPRVDAALRLDLDAMADAGRGAGLVYLCNPNNPTATIHSAADIRAYVDLVGRQSPETVVLIDEAYHEYVDEPSYGTAIPLAMANPAGGRHPHLLEGVRHGWAPGRICGGSTGHPGEDGGLAARLEHQPAVPGGRRRRRGATPPISPSSSAATGPPAHILASFSSVPGIRSPGARRTS